MKKEPMIIWQKWSDPFGGDDEDYSNLDEEPTFNDNDFEDSESNYPKQSIKKNFIGIKAIATPMGIIPLTEHTASGKIFNFWLAHANFNITPKIANIIEQIDGVETLDIFTRYRFRIGVGKAFTDSEVMRNINKKLYKESEYVN